MENNVLLDSHALTKIQSIILVAVIVIAALGIVYFLAHQPEQSSETIKIGILSDLDDIQGMQIWKGAKLAVEQINAEGGMLGKQIELIGEDHNLESGVDMIEVNSALTRLISHDNVDFIIGQISNAIGFGVQDKIYENRIIFASLGANAESLSQRVLDEYDKYKYYFSLSFNQSSAFHGMSDVLAYFKDNTDLRKIGFISVDVEGWTSLMDGLDTYLTEVYEFETLYKATYPIGTFDFSSYFAAAEEAEVEILLTLISGTDGILVLKEYADRESRMVIWGLNSAASSPDFWEETDGKCKYTSYIGGVLTGEGYPLTNHTIQYIEEYTERWNDELGDPSGYNALRYILYDAINRAGTIETEAVIKALEETSIETVDRREFEFTSNHDILIAQSWDPETTSSIVFQFQSEGERVPVYPIKIKEEVGGSYIYPPWSGPWNNIS